MVHRKIKRVFLGNIKSKIGYFQYKSHGQGYNVIRHIVI